MIFPWQSRRLYSFRKLSHMHVPDIYGILTLKAPLDYPFAEEKVQNWIFKLHFCKAINTFAFAKDTSLVKSYF